MNIQNAVRNALVDTGRISPRDRIEIIRKSGEVASDYVWLEVNVFHGRRKKPCMYWNIRVNMARDLIYWDASTFVYL